jgi:hypothetical protein
MKCDSQDMSQYTDQAVGWTSEEPWFSYSKASISTVGTIQPPIQWVPGPICQEVEHPEHETDHLLLSSAIISPYAFMIWAGITILVYLNMQDIKTWPKIYAVRNMFVIKHNELRITCMYCIGN